MNVLNRIFLNIKANVNDWLTEKENPEKLVEQVMEEMEQQLIAVRQSVAVAIATQKRTQREISKHQAMVKKYYQKAQLAVHQKQDLMAKEALKHHYEYQKHLQFLQLHNEQQQEIVSKLKQQLNKLEQKIAAAKVKKNLYVARARTAEAVSKIEELTGDMMGVDNQQFFAKMEAKVLELEAESELILNSSKDNLKTKFSSLESEDEIEQQLAKLKAKEK